MDGFASQLADLRRAATRAGVVVAAAGGGGGGDGDDGPKKRGRGGGDHHRGSVDDPSSGRGDHGRRRREDGSRHDRRDNRRRRRRGEDDQRDGSTLGALVERVAETYERDVDAGEGRHRRIRDGRRHVALLFLTIDDLPHEHIWREWLTGSDDDGDECVIVSVICHAKHPERIRSDWLRRRHLLRREFASSSTAAAAGRGGGGGGGSTSFHTRRPEWGSVDIAKAMMDLLEEGLRIGDITENVGDYRRYLSTPSRTTTHVTTSGTDASVYDDDVPPPPVDRFVFVSESCLPVTTLREFEMALFGPRYAPEDEDAGSVVGMWNQPSSKEGQSPYDKSWIRARSTPNNGYARQLQWDAIRERDVPSRYVWKADQWVALTRTHAEAISSLTNGRYLDGRSLWPAFRDVRALDEIYVPTALSILGVVRRPTGGEEIGADDDHDHDRRPLLRSNGESLAGPGIRRRRVTYCDWSVGARNPASFGPAEWKEVASKARGEGCLFARKFVLGGGLSSASSFALGKKREGMAGNGLISVEAWKSAVANLS
ncbi:hypothetical protein ACHAW5_001841 [Stephanodiscus triporus]|uniref:Hexosyltransferase n=1 Tax=Stephanodiscus triporus TaxID=2934178 RepID=A0ABD3MSQ5_9STRA